MAHWPIRFIPPELFPDRCRRLRQGIGRRIALMFRLDVMAGLNFGVY